MGYLKVLSWNLAVLTEDKIVIWENILQYYDVILCQEWGRSEELSELLEHLGFNVYFNDQSVSKGNRGDPPRGAGKGEGICVLVKKFVCSRLIKHTKHATWVEVELLGNKFSLASVYFNPTSSITWRRDPSMSCEEAKEVAFAALKSDISDIKSSSSNKVLVMGDFNAHTGDAPDIDTVADHILEDLGLGLDELVSTSHVPVRRSTMDSSVNDMGRLLLSHCCLDSGLFLLNGRTHGDRSGKCTHAQSVIDYGLVDAPTYSCVQSFKVLAKEDESDHMPIECVLKARGAQEGSRHDQGGSQVLVPRWDPSKREEYVQELESTGPFHELCLIGQGIRDGSLDLVVASERLYKVIHTAAVKVFGVVGKPNPRLPSGRLKNSWYKHCKEGHQKLQQALRQNDSHAAEQYRKEFRRQKRKWKRVYDKKAQEKMLDDLKHNPRKFWTAFQGKRACMLQADIAELQRYWSGLYNVPDHGALGEGGEDLAGLLHRMNSIAFTSAGQATATVLNNDLDEHEVIMGLKKLHSGRAPGPDGLRAEFLKQAFVMETVDDGPPVKRHVLLPVLFDLYQALFSSGEFVRKWSMATLSPIFKKGDAANLDNYRAIAVGSVLGKLYAVILDTRVSVCAEKNGWRAEGQAGFRAGKSTVDHVFVLRHLIESTQKSRKVLYCCFVDFRKAFDRVRRDYLIQRLAELGVHGRMLQAIIQMYWSVPLVPKLHGTVGDAIPSTCGVKQGDPLSPLLFGLFIDEFESWLRQRLPNVGVQMGRKLVQMLLYADDMVLLTHNPMELQQMLDVLHQFCSAKGMEVNVRKTEIVVFRKANTPEVPDQWLYNGETVQRSVEFRYLGIILHETKGMSCAIESLATAARKAMWALFPRFKLAGITDISIKLRMFSCLVVPIMEYCSEVWGPDLLFSCDTLDKLWDNELQKIQSIFLRQLGKLRKSVPTTVVHKEMCMNPVAKGWLRASIDLWRRLGKVPSDSLLGMAVRESLASYAGEGVGSAPKSWAGRFMHTVRSLSQGRDADGTIAEFLATNGLAEPDNDKLAAIPWLKVWGTWDTMLQEPWDKVAAYANPRQSVSSNLIKLSTYHSWFMTGDIPQEELEAGYPQGMPRYIRHTSGIPFTYVKQLMRFRTGAHHLAIETGRWARPKLPRQHRVCSKCSCTVVEDEVHFLFECPAYDRIREKYNTVLFAQFGGCQEASSIITFHDMP